MSQNIEIEFKNLLTRSEFLYVKKFLSFEEDDFKKQVNHYFDTADFSLKEQRCALRIREKKGKYELTLKQPATTGLLETNQTLTLDQAQTVMETGAIPLGPVRSALAPLLPNIEDLVFFGTLITNRAEKTYKNGLIVLDHSTYLNEEDFELEYEVSDEKEGMENFKNLLRQLNIPSRKTDNKIMRFYKQKLKNTRK